MGRTPPVFKKRKFTGNIHTRKLPMGQDRPTQQAAQEPSYVNRNVHNRPSVNSDVNIEFLTSGNRIIDIELLSSAIKQFCACSNCKKNNCVEICEEKRIGLASILQLRCVECKTVFSFSTSRKTNSVFYETNVRMAYGMRCIGKGRESANVLCGMMNLPPPILRFDRINNHILNAIEPLAKEKMLKAAKEAVNVKLFEEEESPTDLCVSVDGSWMKRGHTSNYGIATVISVDTGKVLDIDAKSKYCHKCAVRLEVEEGEEENKWQDIHKTTCCKDYEGPSGGMEVASVVSMFSRSQDQYGVRYTQYLGDGDSKAYKSVLDSNPYVNCDIIKLECIGHVQKRMGGRLRRFLKDMKGVLLDDGKPLGGKGRLTNKAIDSLQVYYGKAIRDNLNSVADMKRAIWAIYFHKLSTDEAPQHSLCPKGADTWCRYNKDPSTYKHKNSIPYAVMTAIKPTFRALADEQLLEKCVHGKTQNSNESFNSVLWNRCPKTKYCGLNVVKISMYDSVLCFNEGESAREEVLKKAGIEGGVFTGYIFNRIDKEKSEKKDSAMSMMEKEARQHNRAQKRGREDQEDQEYEPGAF